jgi:hypothetical protein
LARGIAGDIVAGRLSPFDGARQIWVNLATVSEARDELLGFVGLASEWQDSPEYRDDYDAEIVKEAQAFLSRTADVEA